MTIEFNTSGDDLSDLLQAEPKNPAYGNAGQPWPQDESFARIRNTTPEIKIGPCMRCSGTGRFGNFGTCFKCQGSGKQRMKTFKNSPAVRAVNREKAAVRKQNREVENLETFKRDFPAQWAWIERTAARQDTGSNHGFLDIVRGMPMRIMQYGDLTPGLMGMIEKGMIRDAEYAAKKASQQATVAQVTPPAGFPNLRAAFELVRSKGAKKAQMTFGNVNVSLASATGQNPGALYVKWNGQYAGKIVDTTFRGRNETPEMMAALAAVEADPQGAIKLQAERTAKKLAEAQAEGRTLELPCGCCGIILTDPVSVARGIGPICAGKWGF